MDNIFLEYSKGSSKFGVELSQIFVLKKINQIISSSNCSEYEAIKFFLETFVSEIKGITSYTFSWKDEDNFIHSMSKEL